MLVINYACMYVKGIMLYDKADKSHLTVTSIAWNGRKHKQAIKGIKTCRVSKESVSFEIC
jgi:hypothetical protein